MSKRVPNTSSAANRAAIEKALYDHAIAINDKSLTSYAVLDLPPADLHTGWLVFVPDETGGATVAFSDGTDWRRMQDRNVVS